MNKNKNTDPLTTSELTQALSKLISNVQNAHFAEEMSCLHKSQNLPRKSKLLCLNPFIDKDGLMRVGGRLRNANVNFDHKHPLILPEKHALTTLIIRYTHVQQLHAALSQH